MSILLQTLTKRYGRQTIVNNVSLEVCDGELFVLLGSSGSGKSTILRLIAGLVQPDSGRILLHGRNVTGLAPQPRGTGFVFQNYSIFRHMSLAENIEFGLKIRKIDPGERIKRRDELLDLVGLSGLGDRFPDQISGGQQQRVALARALAYEPSVLLLDEPLGALDVKIRAQLRRSLKEIQRRLRVTTILVTHDQEEAFELGDRIGVLERGVLLEVDEPERLYARPRTLFTASFLGGGTVLSGRMVEGRAVFGPITLDVPVDRPHEEAASVELLVRPEHVILSSTPPAPEQIALGKGVVIEHTFAGSQRRVRLRLPRLPGTRQITPVPIFGETGLLVDAVVSADFLLPQAAEQWVSLRAWTILQQSAPQLLVLDAATGPDSVLILARQIASKIRASLSVLAWSGGEASAEWRQQVQHRLEVAGLADVDLHVGSGRLAEQVEGQRAGVLFDLLILPRHLHTSGSTLAPSLIGILEKTDIPVLVAGQAIPAELEHILICTRAGEPGKSDVRLGGRLARQLGAKVTLLHVTSPGSEPRKHIRRHLQSASAVLAALEVPHEVQTRDGEPTTEILKAAESHHLVVIGGHGPQTHSVFATDNITLQVLRGVTCAVLVVPAEE